MRKVAVISLNAPRKEIREHEVRTPRPDLLHDVSDMNPGCELRAVLQDHSCQEECQFRSQQEASANTKSPGAGGPCLLGSGFSQVLPQFLGGQTHDSQEGG